MSSSPAFDRDAYWRRIRRLTLTLLAIWFLAGPVLSILLVERLNRSSLGGIPLGFWMAQQGSIYVFVLLIFVYAVVAGRIDREFGVQETPETTQHTTHR